MWDWLFGRKKAGGLPEYSALRSCPSRALPADLKAHERSEAFAEGRERMRGELLARPPDIDKPLLTELVAPDGRGLLTLTLPDARKCLLVFTSFVRATDYRDCHLKDGDATSCFGRQRRSSRS
jgi:hypothetical protein